MTLPLTLVCAGGLVGWLGVFGWRLLVASQSSSLGQVFFAYATLATACSAALALGWIAFRASFPRTIKGLVTSVSITQPSLLEAHPTLVVHLDRERVLVSGCLIPTHELPIGSAVRMTVAPFGIVTALS